MTVAELNAELVLMWLDELTPTAGIRRPDCEGASLHAVGGIELEIHWRVYWKFASPYSRDSFCK